MILGTIQVRMGSTRLPGKALRPILGRPMLWHQYHRLCASALIDKVVIMTADNADNKPIMEFAEKNGIEYFAGSEQDLIGRVYATAKKFKATIIVRTTGDCPLIDPRVTDTVIRYFLKNRDRFDYVTNGIPHTYPDGLDTAVMPRTTVEKGADTITEPYWREWFSRYILDHTDIFRVGHVKSDTDLSAFRWTVDYPEDFRFVTEIFKRLYSEGKAFGMEDVLKLLEKEPGLTEINAMHKGSATPPAASKEACP